MGIDNIKKVVGFGLKLGAAVASALSATSSIGKITAMLTLVEDLPLLVGVDYAVLKAEVSQLTPAELDELNTYIDTQFSIPDADKEAKIEAAISVVIDLAKLVEKAVAMAKT